MNKAELVEQMSKDTKMPKSSCKEALECFITLVEKTLKKGKPVVLTGFGTFDIADRKARIGVNPITGQKIKIPARRVPKFRAGKKLKGMVA
ncbi:MAG: HU family DNA-binding protein [bacterium]|jgi:DNA-binding protein HU-beta